MILAGTKATLLRDEALLLVLGRNENSICAPPTLCHVCLIGKANLTLKQFQTGLKNRSNDCSSSPCNRGFSLLIKLTNKMVPCTLALAWFQLPMSQVLAIPLLNTVIKRKHSHKNLQLLYPNRHPCDNIPILFICPSLLFLSLFGLITPLF